LNFKRALILFPQAFKRLWPWFIFSQGVGVITSFLVDSVKRENEVHLILAVVSILIAQIILSLFGLIVVNQVLEDQSHEKPTSQIWVSVRENLKYIFINYARALLKTVLGFILFLIPGIILWVQFTFVPYVVLFDSQFKAGKVDALERSKALVKGHFWRLSGILILCLLLSMVPELCLGAVNPLESPVIFTVLFFVGLILDLYGDIVIYCVYKDRVQNF
jgi:hypothetical protein